jgi:hypothetical protein
MAVGDGGSEVSLGSANVFNCPINCLAMGLAVKACSEADHQLAVSKHAYRVSFQVGVTNPGKTLKGVPHGECFCLVVGPSWSIISSGTYYLSLFMVKNDEASGTMSVLSTSIELHMDSGTWRKSGLSGKMDRFAEGSLSCLHRVLVEVVVCRCSLVHS